MLASSPEFPELQFDKFRLPEFCHILVPSVLSLNIFLSIV